MHLRPTYQQWAPLGVMCMVVAFLLVEAAASPPAMGAAPAGTPDAAQSAHGGAKIQISPPIIELRVEAGSTVTRTITLTNAGDTAFTAVFEHADFGFQDETYEPVFIESAAPETVPFTTRGWFSVPQERFTLAPGESEQVDLRITVPDNIGAGPRLGAAFFRTAVDDDPSSTGAQVRTSARTGPLIFIDVLGGDPPEGRLVSFSGPRVATDGPLEFEATIENLSGSFLTFDASLTMQGRTSVDPVQLQSGLFVIQGEPRTVTMTVDQTGLVPFRYRATAEFLIDPSGERLAAEHVVWIIPLWLRLLLVVIGLTSLGGLIIAGLNLRDQWLLRKYLAEGLPDDDLDDDVLDGDELDEGEFMSVRVRDSRPQSDE